jgi:hypothetical protein
MVENIIKELMKKLNISEEQAKGGLAVLLKFCQEKLGEKDFQRITDLLGSNWQELMKAAPKASANLMGKLGGLASVFSEKAGAMANLASGFKSVNIDMGKIQQFVDVTLTYLQEKGGPQVKELLSKFLKR